MSGIISTHLAASFRSREVTSYEMTSYRTSYQIEICSFTNEKRKTLKKVLHTIHNSVIC